MRAVLRFTRVLLIGAIAFASPVVAQSRLTLPTAGGPDGAELRIATPDGTVQRFTVAPGRTPDLDLSDAARWPAGDYRFELLPTRIVRGPAAESAARARADGETTPALGWPPPLEPITGVFRIAEDRGVSVITYPEPVAADDRDTPDGKRAAPARAKDQVIPDDLIVQGSTCSGFDCVNNESFGFDTIRLKENNLRLKFEDTSVSTFPTNDWQLTANDSASGGSSKFSIEDVTGARVPFTVLAGAPTDAMFVDAFGRVGLRTSTPVLDLHTSTPNTPAIRLEQTNAGGFTAQTWDIGANEANFFVRDVTAGSRLSFRIRPGAPTSSLDIHADGQIGMGTASPQARLHVLESDTGATDPLLRVDRTVADDPDTPANEAGTVTLLRADPTGDLYVRGTVSQLSSRLAKTDAQVIDGAALLAALERLPLQSWRYRESGRADRHVGPYAEDFHAAFGLGGSATQMAASDVAGVALAAAQALQRELDARDRRIADLEERLARLEALLAPRGSVARAD